MRSRPRKKPTGKRKNVQRPAVAAGARPARSRARTGKARPAVPGVVFPGSRQRRLPPGPKRAGARRRNSRNMPPGRPMPCPAGGRSAGNSGARPGSRSRCFWPVAGPTCHVRPCPKKISACRWRRVTTCSPCWKSWGTASSPCAGVWCWPGARSPRPGPRTSGRNRAGSPSLPSAAGRGSSRPCNATGGRISPLSAGMCGVCASCRSSCPMWRHGPCISARPPRPRRWGPSPCGKKT